MWVLGIPTPCFETTGSENIEVLVPDDCTGFSSITSDLENWAHSESMSIVDVEAELEEKAGVRYHSTGGVSEEGRSGGGYVVGNA